MSFQPTSEHRMQRGIIGALLLGLLLCLPLNAESGIDEPPEWRSQRRIPKVNRSPNSESTDEGEPRSRLDLSGRRRKTKKTDFGGADVGGYFGAAFAGTFASETEAFGKMFSVRSQFPLATGFSLGVNFDVQPAVDIPGARVSPNWGFSATANYYFQQRTLFGPWVQAGIGFLRSSATLGDGTKVLTTLGTFVGTLGWRFEVVADVNIGLSGGIFGALASGGAISMLPTVALEAGMTF